MSARHPTTALLVLVLALACCGGDKAQKPSAGPSAEPAPLHPGPPKPWAEMSHEERGEYMESTLLPTMKPIFEAWDADFFAS